MGSYRLIEHTADLAAEVKGHDLAELMISAAGAWLECAFENSGEINSGSQLSDKKTIELQEKSSEELLVGFVSELNYLLNVKKWIACTFPDNFRITRTEQGLRLYADVYGVPYDPHLHRLIYEIKAVTFHQMNIIEENDELKTVIVFDI